MDTIGWPAATVCRTSVGTVIARRIYINYVSFPRLGLLCKWLFCRVADVSDRVCAPRHRRTYCKQASSMLVRRRLSDFVRVLIEDRTKIIRIIWLHKSERIGIAISGLVCFISARIIVVKGTARWKFHEWVKCMFSVDGFYPSIDRERIGIMIRVCGM